MYLSDYLRKVKRHKIGHDFHIIGYKFHNIKCNFIIIIFCIFISSVNSEAKMTLTVFFFFFYEVLHLKRYISASKRLNGMWGLKAFHFDSLRKVRHTPPSWGTASTGRWCTCSARPRCWGGATSEWFGILQADLWTLRSHTHTHVYKPCEDRPLTTGPRRDITTPGRGVASETWF